MVVAVVVETTGFPRLSLCLLFADVIGDGCDTIVGETVVVIDAC